MLSVQVLADAGEDITSAAEAAAPHGWEVLVGYVRGREPPGLGHPAVTPVPVEDGPRDRKRIALAAASSHDYCVMIEPWESISSGAGQLAAAAASGATVRTMVVQGDMVTKPVRGWDRRRASPRQAVLECVQPDSDARLIDCTFDSSAAPPTARLIPLAKAWAKEEPLSAVPDYCLACLHLGAGDLDAFWAGSDAFLFKAKKPSMAVVMTRYYRAMVAGLSRRRPREAIENLLVCLTARPTMAEFWCLLGDVFATAGDPGRAREFYRNAMDMGRARDFADPWPVQMSKYRDYPQSRIDMITGADASPGQQPHPVPPVP